MSRITLRGKVVTEWLSKWPTLPTRQLSRMIYNDGDNYKLFNSIEAVRSLIRYYRGANGQRSKECVSTKKHFRKFKIIEHE